MELFIKIKKYVFWVCVAILIFNVASLISYMFFDKPVWVPVYDFMRFVLLLFWYILSTIGAFVGVLLVIDEDFAKNIFQ